VRVLVTGASGYVGREVCGRLEADGREVVRFSRSSGGDIGDPDSVRAAVDGVDAIVHLVAILDGSDAQFEAVNVQGPRNVVAAAAATGVRRLVHMSALGVTEAHAPLTRYWGTKWAGKRAVVESDLNWTVIEPSFVFGAGGGALKAFESLIRLPVAPVIGDGRYRHQPVWVGDVAAAFSAALDRPETIGKRYELGGPQVFEFNDLLDELARVTGRSPKPKLHAPVRLMKLQAGVLQYFPPPLRVTREQIVMLVEGTECDLAPMRGELGIEPASIAEAYTR
jgi:uncharacterized protein YbjT (DUF2867 family)